MLQIVCVYMCIILYIDLENRLFVESLKFLQNHPPNNAFSTQGDWSFIKQSMRVYFYQLILSNGFKMVIFLP